MKSFDVDSVLICDYVIVGIDGKMTLAGIVGAEIVLLQEPPYWYPLFICVSLIPKKPKFDFAAQFVDPKGEAIISIDGEAEDPTAKQSDALKFNRVNMNFQLPPVKFSGAGVYAVEVFSKSEPKNKFVRHINVITGPHPGMRAWAINASAKIMGNVLTPGVIPSPPMPSS